jgi:uncharacterized protein (TIGR00730 family)
MIKSVAVFCSASKAARTERLYGYTAYLVGFNLALYDKKVIYGGGKSGLMGKLAEGVAAWKWGKLRGVSVDCLESERGDGKNTSVIAHNMSKRKRLMSQEAEAYIILPGGFGTLDELFEVLTLQQLGVEDKPIYIVELEFGYFTTMIKELIIGLKDIGTITQKDIDRIHFVSNVKKLMSHLNFGEFVE